MKRRKNSIKERFLALPLWFWMVFAAIIAVVESIRRFCFNGGCLLMDIFDFPCPTCGMTRAMLCVMIFKFDLAMKYNPAFWVAPLCGICLIMSFIDKKHPKIWYGIFAFLILVLISVWVVYRIILGVPLEKVSA